MNITTLRQRLDRLEAKSGSAVRAPVLHPLAKLLDVLVAYHLGGLAENDSIAAGMARGLGYEKGRDLMDGLRAGSGTPRRDDLNARWRDAVGRLFASKGTVPDCDGPTFAATLEALYHEMPDRVRGHSFMAGCEGLFEVA